MNKQFTSEEVGQMWEDNASLWSLLVRQGHDLYRDYVNTPGFFSILPNINGLKGLDLGCGEGHNTRLLAAQDADMTAIDISPTFIQLAKRQEEKDLMGIKYILANACSLPFLDCSFDFIASFVALMDIPEYEAALGEAYRVLKKNGFFQFSITHPCFWTPDIQWIYNEKGEKQAMACHSYFDVSNGTVNKWIFDGAPQELMQEKGVFKTPLFKRTLSEWVNALVQTGFVIECFHEPRPINSAIKKYPVLGGSDIVPFFLIIRCYKK